MFFFVFLLKEGQGLGWMNICMYICREREIPIPPNIILNLFSCDARDETGRARPLPGAYIFFGASDYVALNTHISMLSLVVLG